MPPSPKGGKSQGGKDVPNPETPVVLCESPLSADVAAVPKVESVVFEDECCITAVEDPFAVVSGVWVFQGEVFVPSSPPLSEGVAFGLKNPPLLEGVAFVPTGPLLLEGAAFVPKGLLAEGALELLLLGLPTSTLERPSADGALNTLLLKEPNPEKPIMLGGVPLDASLFAVVLSKMPIELAFGVLPLADEAAEPNRPALGVVFETSLFEDVAFEPKRRGDGVLDVSLLGDTPPLRPEKSRTVDEDVSAPNRFLIERG